MLISICCVYSIIVTHTVSVINSFLACLSVIHLVVTWTLNGIHAELNPCSGNSRVSDFRLNKGTMFYFYPCLKERRLTHHKVIISASHVWRKKSDVSVRNRQTAAEVNPCWSIMRSPYLQPTKPLTRSLTPVPPPSIRPSVGGLPSTGQTDQVKSAIPIQGQERYADLTSETAAHFARSIPQDKRKGWEPSVCFLREGRVLATHSMTFALVSDCVMLLGNGKGFA